MQQVG